MPSGDGTMLSVSIPGIPPGCDCGDESVEFVQANIVVTVSGLSKSLSGEKLDLISIAIDKLAVGQDDDLPALVAAAPPGRCLVLASGVNHAGPVTIGPSRRAITLTSDLPEFPGLTQVFGEFDGTAANVATLTIDGAGDGICVSGIDLVLGNSGAKVTGSTRPVFKSCKFDNNTGTGTNGGGVTVVEGARPVLFDCEVSLNYASDGGGVRISAASALIVETRVHDNQASGFGGGLYLGDTASDLLIADSEVWSNNLGGVHPASGGGVYWTGTTLQAPARGSVCRSHVFSNTAIGYGAGLFIDKHVAPVISGNRIESNETCGSGGGVCVWEFNLNVFAICDNVFADNAAVFGGAVALLKKTEVQFFGNVVHGNQAKYELCPKKMDDPDALAPGIYVKDAGPAIVHNTIVANCVAEAPAFAQGGGIHGETLGTGFPKFWDNILVNNVGWEIFSTTALDSEGDNLWGNAGFDSTGVDESIKIFEALTFFTEGYSNLTGVNPLFAGGEVTCDVTLDEPMLDLVPTNPLVVCSASDGCNRGALLGECPGCAFAPCEVPAFDDCNGDGIDDLAQIVVGVLLDVDPMNGVPDACEVTSPPPCIGDLDGTGMVDGGDLGLLLSAWGDCEGCDADLSGDGVVDGGDLGLVLAAWGSCG